MRDIHEQADSLAEAARYWSRHQADGPRQQPDRKIFKLVPESGQIGTVTSQEKYFKFG
jgi:hypothetical protein